MKKAVISTGGKQYVVAEGDTLLVELLAGDTKTTSFDALLVIDGDKTTVGLPTVKGVTVAADIITADEKQDKVTAIRYKAKKRVHKVRGHRQRKAEIKITKISTTKA